MNFKQIDRELMTQLGHMEKEFQTFHGFRHLWAELIANCIDCGVAREVLERKQLESLSQALGAAYTIAQMLGIQWIKAEISQAEAFNKIRNQKHFISNATWPIEAGIPGNFSADNHDTYEQAKAVCTMLKSNGLGGEGKHFPIRTWVEEVVPGGFKQVDEKSNCTEDEELIQQCIEVMRNDREHCGVALLQRRLKLGYTRSSRIMDELEFRKVVGPHKDGGEPRDFLLKD